MSVLGGCSTFLEPLAKEANVKLLQKGRTEDQQAIIKYFHTGGGCGGGFSVLKDKDFDKLLGDTVQSVDVKANAMMKLGVDPAQVNEVSPVFIDGYYVDFKDVEKGDIFIKEGKDDIFRSSSYELACILFGVHQLYIYSYRFSLVNLQTYEEAYEFFYRDIDSISIDTDTREKLTTGKGCLGFLNWRYIPNPSLKLFITVPGSKFSCSMRPELEQSVMGLRNLVRDKKNQ
jgi:hypothetical protein